VNDSLSLSEEETVAACAIPTSPDPRHLSTTSKVNAKYLRIQGPPTNKLIGISSNMNQHLTSLLVSTKQCKPSKIKKIFHSQFYLKAIIEAGDSEKERLRRELQRSRDQVNALLSQQSSNLKTS